MTNFGNYLNSCLMVIVDPQDTENYLVEVTNRALP
jgi:hypothetical protein